MKMTCRVLSILIEFLLLQVYIACFSATTTNNTTDQGALLALKAHISNDPNDFLGNNWSTIAPVCSWVGVTCDARQRVTKLDLSNMGLEGTIPSQIGNLGQLQNLSLSTNSFGGSIPQEIGKLTLLKNLYLDHNNFSGSTPSSLGNCSLLQEINFNGNNLAVFFCHSGAIPPAIGNLGRLQILRMKDNVLSGEIPSMLFNISTLKAIVMSTNRLSGILPSTMGLFLPNLVELLLGGNKLDGMIPVSITNASKLEFLDLSDNSFSGFIPGTLGNLRNLQKLLLANNHLTSESSTPRSSLFTSLANCKQLRKVMLSGNLLNLTLSASISNLSNTLEQFQANNCNCKGFIPREISNLTNLIGLSMANNQLTGNVPNTIGRLEKLQVLYLEGNRLLGTIPDSVCSLESLAYLSFGGNKLTGSIPKCFGNLTGLTSLNLSSNRLSSTIPSINWPFSIMDFNMSSNYLSGFIPEEMGFMTAVENIDLSINNFSGEIPASIGSLDAVETLDLSSNNLSDVIPHSIFLLRGVRYLSLSKNGLQGLIHSDIEYSRFLEFLDLSCNNLTGEIPESLETMKNLKYFNVSFNKLEGKIPTEGPFLNFSAESYIMNKGLCGAPHLLVPPCKSIVSHHPVQVSFLLKLLIPILSIIVASYIFMRLKLTNGKKPSRVTRRSSPVLEKYMAEIKQSNRRYTYLELQQATDWFSEEYLISIGHFGSVYRGMLKDGQVVAIKVFNVEEELSLRSFEVECQVLRRIEHSNIIRTICISNSSNFKALIMEHMANGSLEKWLHTHNYDLDILQRLNLMIGIAKALNYLHQIRIVHCDIKPSNILLDENMTAHVSDFGIATCLDQVSGIPTVQNKIMYTFGYVAPEYGLYGNVSKLTDVYSFGILLMETFTGKKPTDKMFTAEMSLRSWVLESVTSQVERVIDPSLLQNEEESLDHQKRRLSKILKLSLRCSSESPNDRLSMNDVESYLLNIWRPLNQSGIY